MKNIYFKSIKIINFLSVGKEPVVIDFKQGLNIITGVNHDKVDRANGVGKSTILDAIYYAIFGSTMRDLKKELIPNFKYSDEISEVVLNFEVEENGKKSTHKIVRNINPTKCYYYLDGEDKTLSTMSKTQEHLNSLFETNPIVFQNSVIMTVNNTVPFMALDKKDKRSFIEGIMDLNLFGEMAKVIREDHSNTKKAYEIENTKFPETKTSLETLTKQNDFFEENRQKKIAALEEKKKELKSRLGNLACLPDEEIKKLKAELEEINKELSSNEEMNKKIDDFVNKHNTKVANLDYIIKTALKNKANTPKKTGSCDFCSKDLSSFYEKDYNEKVCKFDEEVKKAEEDKKVIKEKLDKCDAKRMELRTSTNLLKNKKEEREKTIRSHEANLSTHKILSESLKDLDNSIKDVKEEKNLLKELILEKEAKIKEYKENIEKLVEKLEIIDNARFLVSDEGIKTFLIKKVIGILNQKINFFLKKLDGNATIKFNETFEETITNDRGVECSYYNFSGAEKKAIDLAMLFAFQDIRKVQSSVWFNVLFFDELFDSSVDEKGIEAILNIIKERLDKYKECVYIVSHRKESTKYCTNGEVIYLEKRNGLTQRSELSAK